ncbi:hypothetical protein ColKHC_11953 [Colletotrichum higginsianum]|nr:hypothetical protein ColKHC_11953 [Colletotrichum higginsianum]
MDRKWGGRLGRGILWVNETLIGRKFRGDRDPLFKGYTSWSLHPMIVFHVLHPSYSRKTREMTDDAMQGNLRI